jgi:hypothetical protein
LNDLDRELSDDTLNELAAEDILQEEFGHLSINALSSSDTTNCIKIKARVKDKVMLILLDSGSSHSFVSSQFVDIAQLQTEPIQQKKVKLANGEWMITDRAVSQLQWYCQGYTLCSDMIVLNMHPYDAILGFDWLQAHSPMQCDWLSKTLQFTEAGKFIKLQGLVEPPCQLSAISATKVCNSTKGNDIWAFVLLDHVPEHIFTTMSEPPSLPTAINTLLQSYSDIFQEPTSLPPQRTYDHAIPLIPGSIPINTRPYHYSSHHKTEIERQV